MTISNKFAVGTRVYYWPGGYQGDEARKAYGTVISEAEVIRLKPSFSEWALTDTQVWCYWDNPEGIGYMPESRCFTDEYDYTPTQEGDRDDDI